jgi:hypothetical protein
VSATGFLREIRPDWVTAGPGILRANLAHW